ncbi:MAG: hypothetical protein E2604_11085 [Flavobacterium sp.]|nr:hypothetical protein [Flavobacterium sp.]
MKKFNHIRAAVIAFLFMGAAFVFFGIFGRLIKSEIKSKCDVKEIDYGTGNWSISLKEIDIDSCQYIVARYPGRNVQIIHKQNCKFCENRKKLPLY